MDRILVRTKLQAAVVRAMLDAGLAGPKAVVYEIQGADPGDSHLRPMRRLFRDHAVSIRCVRRGVLGLPGMAAWLWLLILRARLRGERLFVANLHWAALGLALRLQPGAGIFGFDDGTANVQRRPGSFLWDHASERRGPGGWLSRRLFPRGVSAFTRSRLVWHATIFQGLENVVPADRLRPIKLDWSSLLDPEDAGKLPAHVDRILVGSVYAELNQRLTVPMSGAEIARAEAWADFVIPHPRQGGDSEYADVLRRYPAEAIIEHYARRGRLEVAHFDSTVSLSFRGDERVVFTNLLEGRGTPPPGGQAPRPGDRGIQDKEEFR